MPMSNSTVYRWRNIGASDGALRRLPKSRWRGLPARHPGRFAVASQHPGGGALEQYEPGPLILAQNHELQTVRIRNTPDLAWLLQ